MRIIKALHILLQKNRVSSSKTNDEAVAKKTEAIQNESQKGKGPADFQCILRKAPRNLKIRFAKRCKMRRKRINDY